MNILITSAGRRTYMVEYFREALSGRGLVYASNSVLSSALYAADGYFLTPLIYTDEYIPFLLGRCRELGIDMLLSLFDADLPVLAAHRAEFEAIGVRLAISDSDTVSMANDKLLMCRALQAQGVDTPVTAALLEETLNMTADGRLGFPLIVKPRFGMGSIGLIEAAGESELRAAFSMCGRRIAGSYLRYEAASVPGEAVIAQELIRGTEYGLDLVSDLDGRYATFFARKKIAMRAGETDEALILGEDDPEYGILSDVAAKIACALRPRGLIDVDIIISDEDLRPVVIDINARFGGGYPFSHIAGADVPGAYILWAHGLSEEALSRLSVRPGTHGYKEIEMRVREYERD